MIGKLHRSLHIGPEPSGGDVVTPAVVYALGVARSEPLVLVVEDDSGRRERSQGSRHDLPDGAGRGLPVRVRELRQQACGWPGGHVHLRIPGVSRRAARADAGGHSSEAAGTWRRLGRRDFLACVSHRSGRRACRPRCFAGAPRDALTTTSGHCYNRRARGLGSGHPLAASAPWAQP
jgi:hypothetical protein